MKTKILSSLLLIIFSIFLAMSNVTKLFANTIINERIKDKIVEASWSFGDECKTNWVYLFVDESSEINDKNISRSGYINMAISDWCTGEWLYAAGDIFGEKSTIDEFTINGIKAASLRGTVPVYVEKEDGSNEQSSIKIDLKWDGNKDVSRQTYTNRFQTVSDMTMYQLKGSGVTAVVTGFIILEEPDPFKFTEFNGSISGDMTGRKTIIRP